MQKYESAKKLASFLVEKDNTSCKNAYPLEAPLSETRNNGGQSISSSSSQDSNITVENDGEKSNTETPLFLAIKAGCVDIVELILKVYPQAVEGVDGNGSTILHIAIKHRQLWVFDVLHHVGIPWRRLVVQRDKDLNNILHMVGEDSIFKIIQGNPMVQLHEDLILFKMQRVNELCSSCSVDLSLCRNREGKTAKEAFVKNKEDLRKKSIEWVQFLIESSSWLSVFVATVAFAVVLTLPGGLNQETGFPILLNHPFFHVFIIAIVCLNLHITISL
ncbi:ankyrin repeat-containing protein ITN1-like [Cornus florida]|uniref:ankyrin repeat-containing protein ITN1-like n=1 Tax=Cornus florida TaxID=4283 RepID=UPI0028A1ADAD|nr:ankyrin repeat-containing protein ITN1-like [Cornus florida]